MRDKGASRGNGENAIGHTQGTALKGRRFESIEEQNETAKTLTLSTAEHLKVGFRPWLKFQLVRGSVFSRREQRKSQRGKISPRFDRPTFDFC